MIKTAQAAGACLRRHVCRFPRRQWSHKMV